MKLHIRQESKDGCENLIIFSACSWHDKEQGGNSCVRVGECQYKE